jgi:hypothetical protein
MQYDVWPLNAKCSHKRSSVWRYDLRIEAVDTRRVTSVVSTLRGAAPSASVLLDWASRTAALIEDPAARMKVIDLAGDQMTRSGDRAHLQLEVGEEGEPSGLWYVNVGGRDFFDQTPTIKILPGLDPDPFFTAGKSQQKPELTETGMRLLASAYAPVLRFARGEMFYPLAIEAYARHSRLCQFTVEVPEATHDCRPPSEANLTERLPPPRPGWFYALDIEGVTPEDEVEAYHEVEQAMRDASDGQYTVYWHFAPGREANTAYLEYWFFYSFNHYKNQHEGDWEMIALEFQWSERSPFDAWYRDPIGASYSAHTRSRWRTFDQVESEGEFLEKHPIVYVALGSHANYFFLDRHKVVECWPSWWVSLCVHLREMGAAPGLELQPGDYELRALGDTAFTGRYGPENYAAGARRGKGPEDPRVRPEWADPATLFTADRRDLLPQP